MQHITGIARNQMVFTSLEDPISKDNSLRFIDAFVENIDLKSSMKTSDPLVEIPC